MREAWAEQDGTVHNPKRTGGGGGVEDAGDNGKSRVVVEFACESELGTWEMIEAVGIEYIDRPDVAGNDVRDGGGTAKGDHDVVAALGKGKVDRGAGGGGDEEEDEKEERRQDAGEGNGAGFHGFVLRGRNLTTRGRPWVSTIGDQSRNGRGGKVFC